MKKRYQVKTKYDRSKSKKVSNRSFGVKALSAKFLILALVFSNFFGIIPSLTPVAAQNVVTVTADQPNIWTLEQAHYLLAQMHRRNLDLKAKNLSPLDANDINGINIDVLRSILEVGATYNEADAFNNNLVKQDKNFNAERRRQLIKDLDGLNEESVNLTRTIARLKRQKETAENDDEKAKIEAEIQEKTEIKAAVDRQIELKTAELGTLGSANGSVTATSSGGGFDPSKFPSGGFDETFRAKAAEIIDSFKTNPQLNASLQLDNFLQLQYEIISKQLTLLRDEVGPGERLIFLELPQSINSSYDKSDDMWAQSRWKIGGFTRCELTIANQSIPCQKILNLSSSERQNRPPRTTSDIFNAITSPPTYFDKFHLTLTDVRDFENLPKEVFGNDESPTTKLFMQFATDEEKSTINNFQNELRQLKSLQENYEREVKTLATDSAIKKNREDIEQRESYIKKRRKINDNNSRNLISLTLNLINKAIDSSDQLNRVTELNIDFLSSRTKLLNKIEARDENDKKLLNRLWIEDLFSGELYKLREEDFSSKYVNLSDTKVVDGNNIDNRLVRTVEMIPRQSSFNVNDVKIRNKSGAFNFMASFLFGFGANLDYQRQRERYSQFVQQELYSSAFGKGSREFGWTFTSMPGTDRLLSGLRTTYAIVIVPQEATSILLESTGCSFDRTQAQPNDFAAAKVWKKDSRNTCSASKKFMVTIPGGGFDSNNDFYVSGLTYEPVEKGKRIVVSIYGNNFSSQIGVMINGVALPSSIGLAQRFILDDSIVGGKVYEDFSKEKKVSGAFERVDSNQIVVSFELVDGKDGTPIITLVSPGKAVDLNSLSDLYINGKRNKSLKDEQDREVKWMFGEKPKSDFKIKNVQIFNNGADAAGIIQLTALITGSSLVNISNVFVNGEDTGQLTFGVNNVVQVKFKAPQDDKIHIVIVSGDETIKIEPIANPAKPKPVETPTPTKPEIKKDELDFEVVSTEKYFLGENKEIPSHPLVKIKGIGFKDITTNIGELTINSDKEASITIPNPKPVQTIILLNNKKTVYAQRVVQMPALE